MHGKDGEQRRIGEKTEKKKQRDQIYIILLYLRPLYLKPILRESKH